MRKSKSFYIFLDNTFAYRPVMRYVFLLALFIVVLYGWWPGSMSPDSYHALQQSITGRYTDWHPPILAWIWRRFLLFGITPASMLIFHTAMLYCGALLLCESRIKNEKAHWLWLFFPIFPWVFANSGLVLKDIAMGASLFLSFALLHFSFYLSCNAKKYIAYILAVLFALYGFLVRHNAPAAFVPIVFYLVQIFRPRFSVAKRICATIITMVLLLCVSNFVNYTLLQANKKFPRRPMMIDEIGNTSRLVGHNLFFRGSGVDDLDVHNLLSPDNYSDTYFDYIDLVTLSDVRLTENWHAVIKNYPMYWALGKLRCFIFFSGIPPHRTNVDAFSVPKHCTNFEYSTSFTYDQHFLSKIFRFCLRILSTPKGFLFLPIVVLLPGVIIFWRLRSSQKQLDLECKMLVASAVTYFLAYGLVTPTSEFRFIYWCAVAISAVLFLRGIEECARWLKEPAGFESNDSIIH